ncbi:ABC transporter substrate-binding protein [Nocardiopsis sp. MG754419]|uniref:ABC transporter substrate-binding protein n=1 Tax=Nocardiopsis sp. MG754419 TaxID=2259865 RepID=UPI001BAD7B8D|nr:sugar ABC transporter substrate-binding protein [Nocardiopsis sp. MG754419]MBR8742944.1 sugar ABC transporter substrate-binding protein [Nocardiopsis sp. MG754419]
MSSRSDIRPRARALPTAAAVGALCLALGACGSGDDTIPEIGAEDVEAALQEGGEITVWAWEPTLERVAEEFEEAHPGVTVNVENVGTGDEQYTALQNALSAGSGLPDVAHIEYFALGQFTIAGHLVDLAPLGAADLEGTYTPGPWDTVQGEDGAVHALPMDSGPLALFYNQDVFDEHDVEIPTTWDEYVEAARELQEADPEVHIAADNGDAGSTTTGIWHSGGRPYQVSGEEVTIDFSDEGTTRYVQTWQQLIDEDLLLPVTSWSDEWYQALGDGSVATLVTGAWMGLNLESGVAEGAGSWRVAPPPAWEEGETSSAESGGSALAVPVGAEHQALAYAFIEYANAGDGVQARIDQGAFPATVADLESEDFLAIESDYFGGQRVNEVYAASAADVSQGWTYLPYQAHANSLFNDTVGQAYVSDTTLAEGLAAWQDASARYGEEQGFAVTSGG